VANICTNICTAFSTTFSQIPYGVAVLSYTVEVPGGTTVAGLATVACAAGYSGTAVAACHAAGEVEKVMVGLREMGVKYRRG
jgi:pyrroline-5-carboxylate reductase